MYKDHSILIFFIQSIMYCFLQNVCCICYTVSHDLYYCRVSLSYNLLLFIICTIYCTNHRFCTPLLFVQFQHVSNLLSVVYISPIQTDITSIVVQFIHNELILIPMWPFLKPCPFIKFHTFGYKLNLVKSKF